MKTKYSAVSESIEKVIILAASWEIAGQKELDYVSLSRLRTHFFVVGEPEILSSLGAP